VIKSEEGVAEGALTVAHSSIDLLPPAAIVRPLIYVHTNVQDTFLVTVSFTQVTSLAETVVSSTFNSNPVVETHCVE
jgi:hypothetical protein